MYISGWSFSQNTYWQQQVNYNIDVPLHDTDNTLQGFERLEYINNSPYTLHFIWFHLWMNAYKNNHTAFAKQLLKNDETGFYFSDEDKKGYINQLNFKVNDQEATLQLKKADSYINQLNITMLNNRILFPHNIILIVDQGKQFIRTGLNGKYF